MMVPLIEIAVLAVFLYYLLSFFWNTRGMDLLYGVLAFLAVFGLVYWLHFPVLEKIILYLGNVAVFALIVIFQPELRMALSKLSFKGRQLRQMNEFDKFLENLSQSVYRLSGKRMGAIVVLENQDSLNEYVSKAVFLDAEFSSELLESIFHANSPLHDGAVIIRGTKIISASTILPLADDHTPLAKSMGTRHRAGIGLSQQTDALVIIVSEETGKVSIARAGVMTPGVKIDRFKGIIRSIFNPPSSESKSRLQALNPWKI